MNKLPKVFFPLLVITFFASCASQVVWDTTLAENAMATITFSGYSPTSYNGIAVSKWYKVKIPAGNASIGGNASISHGGFTFIAKEMEFAFKYEAEKEYIVMGASQDMKWGVKVYNGTVRPENELAFIPFKIQPTFQ
jgi:hypothetical protein